MVADEIRAEVEAKGLIAKNASRRLAVLPTRVKNRALEAMAKGLDGKQDYILEANNKDIKIAEKKKLSGALLDRLLLTPNRLQEISHSLVALSQLPDPVGEVVSMWTRPNGLQIGKMRVPLGVIGIIYEARPNVTADAAGLCLKTGNAVILRGGSEAINSNMAIVDVLVEAASANGVPEGAIQLINTTERVAVEVMLRMNQYLDVLIPRGGEGLIKMVVDNANVPVIQTGVGNCHVYVDDQADLSKAAEIVVNAKTQRPGVCNAMETLLVHQSVSKSFLPPLAERLTTLGVELRGCERTRAVLPEIEKATEKDWATEYLDLILAIKVVVDMEQAIEHIHTYGSGHSESIITENYTRARSFLQAVDAAAVYVNASTRFTDGFQYGFGAEIGISTQKLHARGPMGPQELTSTKYIIYGEGQVRS